ncbi:AraC family transcriptional regulator [Veronia nyctiphanis]|uniref:AraC family transcriptional regulator n=1 Tax=Veronia nyctiphanis TaxID=1278244 RepID=A0A4Q0YQ70_9GAMM|nr:AraC family transcriptional regulator [Veronia nyctiphanis]RXJ73247.1 AraC family transcriptional regulator [Veronia nyctiphanis]
MAGTYSTTSGWLITLTRAMETCGLDVDSCLSDANIDRAWVKDPEKRICLDAFSRLIKLCNDRLTERNFSVILGRSLHPGMFHVLGYSMMTSSTLNDAFKLIVTYQKILTDACRFEIDEGRDSVCLSLAVQQYDMTNRSAMDREVVESFLSVIIGFTRSLIHDKFNLSKLELSFEHPENNTEYLQSFFDCEIEFGCEKTQIVFDRRYLHEPLSVANPVVNLAHKSVLNEFLSRVERHDLTYLIKHEIYKSLALGAPSQQEIAKNLCMSTRNLQRKLFEQGTNYKEILEKTRYSLAMNYMQQAHLSFCEISYLLGFSNVGNFNRAFKRWTGKSPGTYRKTLAESNN